MDRRRMLGVLGATAAGLSAVTGTAAGAQQKPEDRKDPPGQADKSAKTCADCMVQCAKCFRHCARQLADGKRQYATCLVLSADFEIIRPRIARIKSAKF